MTHRTRIKICGVKTIPIAQVVATAGADALGLVFADGSPRRIDTSHAAAIAREVGPFIDTVGLFTTPRLTDIRRTAKAVGLTTLQLHGGQSIRTIERAAPHRVIYAVHFGVDAHTTLRQWNKTYKSIDHLHGLLIDTPDPHATGGTGRAFDWNALADILGKLKLDVPLILAGGLNPENVGRAIALLRPWAVDVSSGVESRKGVKDPAKIRDFCQAVREADTALGRK